jgi:hypothetical protein
MATSLSRLVSILPYLSVDGKYLSQQGVTREVEDETEISLAYVERRFWNAQSKVNQEI